MALIILLFSFLFFSFAYFIYGRFLERNFGIDPRRPTPAHTKKDGVDLVASRHWTILFGHHFASIAGAGPIVGPIIAVSLWGWGPSLLWIVLGTILLGGVHDFGSLIVSLRNDARSISDISEDLISRRAKIFFSSFVLLALILVIAVFAVLTAKTFVVQPEIVLPSLGLIPLAIFVGISLYRLKFNQILVTILGIIVLVILLFLGNLFPLKSPFPQEIYFWMIVLFFYCYFASILPVNILLQPRDYLSSFLLFFSLIIGYLGIFLSPPKINLPIFISWNTESGSLWPMLFVTIACGAISGFHSLIASGTTSKQISTEKDARKIGYGAMVMEGLVAVMAVLAISGAFSSESALNNALKGGGGPIGAFGEGFGKITYSFLGNYGRFLALLVLNAFILTTLDTATRICRYITTELLSIKNRHFSTLFVVFISAALAFTGKWDKIWPIFGASNQLVAALALIVIFTWLISQKRRFFFVTFPAIFMLLTTLGALLYQFKIFLKERNFLLGGIDLVLVLLALFMIFEVKKVRLFKKK
ncbi:MAG: carbon starvation protein A [Candidatus Omnitrophica bacterium]|nr:carbon starvation protein A [Candidatus Omnitrophota bacterium]